MKKFFNIFLFLLIFLNTNVHHAKEILIYADSISYDENYGPTPSLEEVNAWNLITDNWEHFSYEYEDLII